MSISNQERIPVTICTGFLGAGKTTLLNRLLAEPGFQDTAVIVNEFGEAGLDGALIEKAGDRAFAMSTGCLCCTVSGDVRLTLLRLLQEAQQGLVPSFRRMIIETTGLADPMPVLQTFMADHMMLQRFTLNGVATLVDAVYGAHAIERFEEARRQIAVADLLLVTKGDLARDPGSSSDLAALKAGLATLNPNARVMDVSEAKAETVFSLAAFDPSGKPPNVAQWLRFAPRRGDKSHGQIVQPGHQTHDHAHDHGPEHAHDHAHDVNRHGDSASAYCFSAQGPVDPQMLDEAVAALQASFGTDLLRMKGLVEIAGEPGCPRVVHAVGHIASPPRLLEGWPDGVRETRIVVIVGGPGRTAAPEMLLRFLPELMRYEASASRRNL